MYHSGSSSPLSKGSLSTFRHLDRAQLQKYLNYPELDTRPFLKSKINVIILLGFLSNHMCAYRFYPSSKNFQMNSPYWSDDFWEKLLIFEDTDSLMDLTSPAYTVGPIMH